MQDNSRFIGQGSALIKRAALSARSPLIRRLFLCVGIALGLLVASVPARSQSCPYGEDQCSPGFVWRGAFPDDRACVTGAVRDQATDDNAHFVERSYFPNPICKPGWVWREARSGDFVCVTGTTRQQAQDDNAAAASRRDPQCAAPGGSYRGGCKNISFSGGTLSAECKDFDNNYRVRSSIAEASNCLDDIGNFGGYLGCNKRLPPPTGSYRRACDPWVWTTANSIITLCRDPETGKRNRFELQDDRACVGDIFFDDLGMMDSGLRCSRAPLPDGPYRSACKFIWIEGNTLFAKCRMHKNAPWPFGSVVWNPTRLTNVSGCHDEIRSDNGTLKCATAFPAPDLTGKNLAEALQAIVGAGLKIGTLDATCAGLYETLTTVKTQSPSPGDQVRVGDKIDITQCISNQPTGDCPSGEPPRIYEFCVRCPSTISWTTVTPLTVQSCRSADDTKAYEDGLFRNCTVSPGPCP